MKKIIALLLIVISCSMLYFNRPHSEHMTIIETDRKNDIVTVVDENGEAWAFYGVEDWFVGDKCIIFMRGNTIINARYVR